MLHYDANTRTYCSVQGYCHSTMTIGGQYGYCNGVRFLECPADCTTCESFERIENNESEEEA